MRKIENPLHSLNKYRNVKISFDKKRAKNTLSKRKYAELKKRFRGINKAKNTLFRTMDKTEAVLNWTFNIYKVNHEKQ